jgi:hypothetical protein
MERRDSSQERDIRYHFSELSSKEIDYYPELKEYRKIIDKNANFNYILLVNDGIKFFNLYNDAINYLITNNIHNYKLYLLEDVVDNLNPKYITNNTSLDNNNQIQGYGKKRIYEDTSNNPQIPKGIRVYTEVEDFFFKAKSFTHSKYRIDMEIFITSDYSLNTEFIVDTGASSIKLNYDDLPLNVRDLMKRKGYFIRRYKTNNRISTVKFEAFLKIDEDKYINLPFTIPEKPKDNDETDTLYDSRLLGMTFIQLCNTYIRGNKSLEMTLDPDMYDTPLQIYTLEEVKIILKEKENVGIRNNEFLKAMNKIKYGKGIINNSKLIQGKGNIHSQFSTQIDPNRRTKYSHEIALALEEPVQNSFSKEDIIQEVFKAMTEMKLKAKEEKKKKKESLKSPETTKTKKALKILL